MFRNRKIVVAVLYHWHCKCYWKIERRIEWNYCTCYYIVCRFYSLSHRCFPCLSFRNRFQLAGGFTWLISDWSLFFAVNFHFKHVFQTLFTKYLEPVGGGKRKCFLFFQMKMKSLRPPHYVTITITMDDFYDYLLGFETVSMSPSLIPYRRLVRAQSFNLSIDL